MNSYRSRTVQPTTAQINRFICVTRSNFSPVKNFGIHFSRSKWYFSVLCTVCRYFKAKLTTDSNICTSKHTHSFCRWEHIVMFSFTRWCILAKRMMFYRCFSVLVYLLCWGRRLFTPKKRSIRICTANIWVPFGWMGKILTLCLTKTTRKKHLHWYKQSIHSTRYSICMYRMSGICGRVYII